MVGVSPSFDKKTDKQIHVVLWLARLMTD